jgi:hypothetical protein
VCPASSRAKQVQARTAEPTHAEEPTACSSPVPSGSAQPEPAVQPVLTTSSQQTAQAPLPLKPEDARQPGSAE